jgi:CMP-N-acetylneuraminic acid synthetase
MRVLGILPVRAGSKGIPGKNVRLLNGRPLMEWSGLALLNANGLDRVICSTDDELMAETARKIGLEVPFLRPKELADDISRIVDVIIHAINFFKEQGEYYSHIALVQATSPTVSNIDIEKAIRLALEEELDTVISGYEISSQHPNLMFTINKNNRCDWLYNNKKEEARRQDYEKIYVRTGLVYIIKTDIIESNKKLYGDNIGFIQIDEDRSITIDTESDFLRAEDWMKKNG